MIQNPSIPRSSRSRLLLLASSLLVAPLGFSQTADEEEEIFTLSPFEVSGGDDAGYKATSSLAGTRIKTELKDIASSISVVTKDFLQDTRATDNQSLLTYTTNTEIGGVSGNFAGVGNTYIDGVSESANFVQPNNNTRVRGLDSADNTRDYFLSDIPWDSFNVERVELQRGPNSILFGIGSPAGIINTSLNRAYFGDEGSAEIGFGSYGSTRLSVDYNKELIEDQLAVRVAALHENTKFRQDPAFEEDNRIYAALRYTPAFLQGESFKSTFRGNVDHGSIDANRPRTLPPADRITPFFDANAINKQTWDPYYAWAAGIIGYEREVLDGQTKNWWTVQYPGPGIQATANPIFVYDNPNATGVSSVRQASVTTYWGINPEGGLDAGIGGFPYGSNIGIGSYSEFARNANTNGSPNYPAADKGFYKEKSLTDTSVFDFHNNLIDGANKSEWQEWDAYSLAFEQTFLDNKVGYELVYDKQQYDDGQTRNLGSAYVSVDIRENLMVYPWAYGNQVVKNPNAGRAFVGSSTRGNNSARITDRINKRATAYAEVDFRDFMGDSNLSSVLGRHVFNAVASEERYTIENRDWVRYALTEEWPVAFGESNVQNRLTNGNVVLDWMTYLSDDLRDRNTASGLNLGRITAIQNPVGTYNIPYYNSAWKWSLDPQAANYVDPAAEWINPTTLGDGNPVSTQSENPANYVGWVSQPFTVLNADTGDIDQLYTGTAKIRTQTESTGITWQGYFFDGVVVPTWGYREDTQSQRNGSSSSSDEPSGVAIANPDLDPDSFFEKSGDSTSWGVVVHTPQRIADKMPLNSSISLFYNEGRNMRVQNRFGFGGEELPNSEGETTDYGFVINTFDDRLIFKTTLYETFNYNANIASVTTETATLGANTYYLRNLEAWGTASALTNIAAREVAADPDAYSDAQRGVLGQAWYWNWALVDDNAWGQEAAYLPGNDVFDNHPSTAAQTAANNAWLEHLPDQSWFDAYGFPVDVSAARAGDWANAVSNWTPTSGVGGVQPSGGGRINGVWPTGTVDYVSEGVEFELIGNITDNWSISANASKTEASQIALGEELVSYIENAYAKYQTAAGDLRLWWGGDNTVRQYFEDNIWSAYQFQLETNGKLVSELSPWRFNLVTNYDFRDGWLSGVNVGLGYRWQDEKILGYALNEEGDNLDIDKPYWGPTEDHFDLWFGKDIKLTDSIDWRVQVNLRNIGESPDLYPVNVQPDGTPAIYKIQEGFNWFLTNTFSF